MITEKIRVIEVRRCGECPYGKLYNFEEQCTCEELQCEVIPDTIHPDCPLREIEIMKQSVIDHWKKVCEMYPGTGYDPEMISGPKPSNSME
jgi:predicted metal-binding protein